MSVTNEPIGIVNMPTLIRGAQGSPGAPGADGRDGANGATFTPEVSESGVISWTNDGGLDNPEPVNIKGADGVDGVDGIDGAPATLDESGTSVEYGVSASGTVAPSEWQSTVPTVEQGLYLWTKTTIQFNTGSPIVNYSVARQGVDGAGAVVSVNSVSPDASGNVELSASDVGARPSSWTPTAADVGAVPTTRTVNSKALSANITLTAADVGAVPTTRTVNSKALSANISLTASDVGAATKNVYTATIGTSWSGSAAPYSQSVTISGVLATDYPIIDIVPNATYATAKNQEAAWLNIYRAVAAANSITFYAHEKPTIAIPIKVICVR